MKSKLKKLVKIFPLNGKSKFRECILVQKLLPSQCCTLGNYVLLSSYFIYAFLLLIRGLVSPFCDNQTLNTFLGYEVDQLDGAGKVIWFLNGLCVLEMFMIRIWIVYEVKKNKSEDLFFVKLAEQLSPKHEKTIVTCLNVFGSSLLVDFTTICTFASLVQLSNISSTYAYTCHIIWLVSYYFYNRILAYDMILFYGCALGGFFSILHKKNTLNNRLSIYLKQQLSNFDPLLQSYKDLLISLLQFNSMSSFLMLSNKVLIVPFYSGVIYANRAKANNVIINIMKNLFVVGGYIYANRVYWCTAILSIMHTDSMKIYKKFASVLVRNRTLSLNSRRIILQIMEDIDSTRNHLVAREFGNGRVTQWDILAGIGGTAQMYMLIREFGKTLDW